MGPDYSIPPEIIDDLDDEQLVYLLRRDDLDLGELRRKLYAESVNDKLRRAVVRSMKFRLLDTDISALVIDDGEPKESKKKKIEDLKLIFDYCRAATLVQREAIYHLLNEAAWAEYRDEQRDHLQSMRAKQLWNEGQGRSELEQEGLALRVFELSKWVSPTAATRQARTLPGVLKNCQHLLVPHNPWQTFLNLWGAVPAKEWLRLSDELPEIWIRDFNWPK